MEMGVADRKGSSGHPGKAQDGRGPTAQTLREERLAERPRVSIVPGTGSPGSRLGQGSHFCPSPPPKVTFKVCHNGCGASARGHWLREDGWGIPGRGP